jgi:hypothetical protein
MKQQLLAIAKKIKRRAYQRWNNYFHPHGLVCSKVNLLISRLRHRKDFKLRRKIAEKVLMNLSPSEQQTVADFKRQGYCKLQLKDYVDSEIFLKNLRSVSDPIVALDRVEIDKLILKQQLEMGEEFSYGASRFWLDLYEKKHNEFSLDLVLSPKLLRLVVSYMGQLPLIEDIRIMLNPPMGDAIKPIGSQAFHVDTEFSHILKVFINPYPITDDNGPTSFLPKRWTQLKYHQHFPHTISDTELSSAGVDINQELIKATGAPGEMYLVDVGRCLHFGGRSKLGRVIFVASYRSTDYHSTWKTYSKSGGFLRTENMREENLRLLENNT